MNADILKGKWKQFTGKVKETYGDLTDDELMETKGQAEQVSAKIQEKYGKTKEEADEQVQQWSNETEYNENEVDDDGNNSFFHDHNDPNHVTTGTVQDNDKSGKMTDIL